jgi:signal transduction histidine kinase
MAGPAVELTLDLVPQPLMVEVDSGQMEMALLNLVRNAADAMPQGGALVIQTRLEETPDSVMAAVTVKDQGIGMSADVLQRAIEPFYTTKPKGAGTGLGLSMVNGFAAQSGGRMVIESQPGEGTMIALEFPLRTVDEAA